MSIVDIYSKRQKRLEGNVPEIYTYDRIPQKLRQQIWYVFEDSKLCIETRCRSISDVLCREYGVKSLIGSNAGSYVFDLNKFFMSETDTSRVLDVIELIGNMISYYTIKAADSLNELNHRFKENSVGYQFENNHIIRVDSTYMHSEVVKPALALLWNETFRGACDEYLNAHDHYKAGNNKESLNECLKAFESTMRIICKEKGWPCKEHDSAAALIKTCKDNNLFPPYMENHLSALEKILVFGVPTLRNQNGGHGQGAEIKKVDDSMVRYTLNLTGSNIIFLIEQSGL